MNEMHIQLRATCELENSLLAFLASTIRPAKQTYHMILSHCYALKVLVHVVLGSSGQKEAAIGFVSHLLAIDKGTMLLSLHEFTANGCLLVKTAVEVLASNREYSGLYGLLQKLECYANDFYWVMQIITLIRERLPRHYHIGGVVNDIPDANRICVEDDVDDDDYTSSGSYDSVEEIYNSINNFQEYYNEPPCASGTDSCDYGASAGLGGDGNKSNHSNRPLDDAVAISGIASDGSINTFYDFSTNDDEQAGEQQQQQEKFFSADDFLVLE